MYQAANGTWLPGPPVELPPELAESGDGGGAPVTMYAIQSGNALIYGMFERRCLNDGYTLEECAEGLTLPETTAMPSSTAVKFLSNSKLLLLFITIVLSLLY